MANQQDLRQSILHAALNMAGTSAGATADGIVIATDPLIGKLFEDRNVLLTDGGTITFTGTQVQLTENLNITLNQKISGAVPQVISLGSSNQNFVSSGDMWVAVINRTAGTATTSIITAGNPLPAVSNANQEVFLIAKRVDAGDGTQRLYWRNGFAQNAGQTLRLGQGGGSGGSGSGSDLDSLQFQAQFIETFSEGASNANSGVNGTTGFTNATFNAAKNMYTISYDASKTATTTGTAATISGAPAFTVAAGDVAINIATGEVKKITVVTTQTSYTLESAFTANMAGTAICISQCVHTKDIYNYAGAGAALSAAFPGTTMSEIMVDYEDNATTNSNLWTPDVAPVVGYTASVDNSSWTTLTTRATLESATVTSTYCPTSGSALYLRWFAKQSSGSGIVNVITYVAFMQKALATSSGYVVNQAYGATNVTTAQSNLTMSVVGGKSVATLTWNYPLGANSGSAYGALSVFLNGQMIPRLGATNATYNGAYYTELSNNSIQLDSNYSVAAIDLQVIQPVAVVDSNTANTGNVATLQAEMADGFQGYVSQANTLAATTSAGTPAAGSFYSSIIGRASIQDLTQDLKGRFGIHRVMTQAIQQLPTEMGPNGEPVWGVLNDVLNQVRFIGAAWGSNQDTSGERPNATAANSVEITFYGTGLNLLVLGNDLSGTISVDGGAPTTVTLGLSSVLATRNYGANQIIKVASGLTLGVHTATYTTGTTGNVYGYEVVSQFAANSNLVMINPGTIYTGGKQSVLINQSTLAYSAAVTGSTGGRVVEYITNAGTRGQVFQAAAASSTLYPSASHTNEEVARDYYFREFGAGRTDDFSRLAQSTATSVAFTLDDGITTLASTSAFVTNTSSTGQEGVGLGANATLMNFTFVGTGLDILVYDSVAGGADTYTFQIDGGSAQAWPTSTGSLSVRRYRIVSGLSYGTHVFTMNRTTATTYTPSIIKFTTYQPKTPSVPTGSTAVASYNVLATYVAGTTAGANKLATGVMRKANVREFMYKGTWTAALASSDINGYELSSTTTGDTATYTFFGTGFEFRFLNNATTSTWTISVDGSTNLTGFTTSSYGAGVSSFTASTGTIVTSTTATTGNGIQVSNMTLGVHTVIFTKTAGTGIMTIGAMDLIVPIHSYKSNVYGDLQNTLTVGSNSVQDDRLISPIVGSVPVSKAWNQAVGVTSAPSTTSTVFIPMPDMSCSIKTTGGPIEITYNICLQVSAGSTPQLQIYVDGAPVGNAKQITIGAVSTSVDGSDNFIFPVAAGYHKVDVYWLAQSGTISGIVTARNLKVREI